MNRLRRCLVSSLLLSVISLTQATATQPYDEAADARADLQRALLEARAAHKHVLVVFGANWCPDCRELARQMNGNTLAANIAQDYVVLEVDVARLNKNTDLDRQMGRPTRNGIPALAVLRADGTLVKAATGDELAHARQHGDAALLALLRGLLPAPP